MVSNGLHMTEGELVASLARIRGQSASDPEYVELRAELPAEWPV